MPVWGWLVVWGFLILVPLVLGILGSIPWRGVLICEAVLLLPLLLVALFLLALLAPSRRAREHRYYHEVDEARKPGISASRIRDLYIPRVPRDFYIPRVPKDFYLPRRRKR